MKILGKEIINDDNHYGLIEKRISGFAGLELAAGRKSGKVDVLVCAGIKCMVEPISKPPFPHQVRYGTGTEAPSATLREDCSITPVTHTPNRPLHPVRESQEASKC